MAECVITSINPNFGPSGSVVTLKGTIRTADGEYHIHWKSIDTEPLMTGKVTEYKFTDSLAIPPSAKGNYQLILEDVATGAFSGILVKVVPRITIAPATATVGEEIGVRGTSFPPGEVSIKYDGGEVATAIADDVGSFQITLEIPPSIAGEHQITTEPISTEETFTTVPKVVVQPTSGVVGTKIDVTGAGFTPQRVSIKYDDVEVSAATADDRGNFQTAFALPASTEGKHDLTTEPASTVETLTLTPKIAIEPASGFTGTEVILSGTGFSSGEISIRYDEEEVAKAVADSKGNLQTTFEVPLSMAGEHCVTTEPASTVETFTIAPKIAIDLASGHVEAKVGLSGTGFPPGEVSIKYGGREVATAVADSQGNLRATLEIPLSVAGEYQITTEPASTRETFTVIPRVVIEPASGFVGTEVSLSGANFIPGNVSIRYGAKEITTVTTDRKGDFQLTFKIPPSVAGEHRVTTEPASITKTFTVVPKLVIEPASGVVGTRVLVSGTGFPAGETSIMYDDRTIVKAGVDVSGSFQVGFEIPPDIAGEHRITTEPISAVATFTIAPKLEMKPASGGVGTGVLVSGTGLPLGRISLNYDGERIATTTTDDKGNFWVIFEAPPSIAGKHQISAKPASTVETFTMLPKLSIEPASGSVGTKVLVNGAGFPPGEVSLKYDEEEIAVATADDKGGFQTIFEAPPSVAGEHQVTTEPASTIENFTIVPKLTIEPASGFVGTEVFVSGTGFSPGETPLKYDGKEIGRVTVGVSGSFQVSLEIPSDIAGEHQITAGADQW